MFHLSVNQRLYPNLISRPILGHGSQVCQIVIFLQLAQHFLLGLFGRLVRAQDICYGSGGRSLRLHETVV